MRRRGEGFSARVARIDCTFQGINEELVRISQCVDRIGRASEAVRKGQAPFIGHFSCMVGNPAALHTEEGPSTSPTEE